MKTASEKAALTLAALIALAVVAFVVASAMSERRREAAFEKIRKPPAMDAYAPFTKSPVLSPAETGDITESGDTRNAAKVENALGRYQRLSERYDILWERYPEWQEMKDWAGRLSEMSPDERSRMVAFIEANQDFIEEIRRMAEAGGPMSAFELYNGFYDLSLADLPHLVDSREFARMLIMDAFVQGGRADWDTVVADLIACMQLGDALAPEPMLISQLVRMSNYGRAQRALYDTVPPGALTAQQVNQLVDHLAQGDDRQAFADGLAGESILGLAAFERLLERPEDLRVGGTSLSDEALMRVYTSPLARPWFNNDEATYAEFMTEWADLAALPYYEAQPLLEQLERDIEDLPSTRLVSRRVLPSFARTSQAQARHESNIDLMQMGLLLERYYVDHGVYPDSLDAIAPSLGGRLPVDPFTGGSYVYRPSADSFILYGLSHNRVDDGGVHNALEGDLVWRPPREGP